MSQSAVVHKDAGANVDLPDQKQEGDSTMSHMSETEAPAARDSGRLESPSQGNHPQPEYTSDAVLVEYQKNPAKAIADALNFVHTHIDPTQLPAHYADIYQAVLRARSEGSKPVDAAREATYQLPTESAERIWSEICQMAKITLKETNRTSTWLDLDEKVAPITWQWDLWLARGVLTLLAAKSGVGKSALVLRIMGCYLLGEPWPDGSPFSGPRGDVLWVETEAGQAINLDRGKQWGYPLDRIHNTFVDPLADVFLDNDEHFAAVKKLAHDPRIRLIAIDSLTGAHGGQEKESHDMYPVVKKLAELAQATNKPVILTHHLRKRGIQDSEEITLDRVRGSGAIVQPARVVWAMSCPDSSQPDLKRLNVIKSNIGRFPEPIGLQIGDDGVTFTEAPEIPESVSAREDAIAFLQDLLTNGHVPADVVRREAGARNISSSTLNRAKKPAGVESFRDGSSWYWRMIGTD